jgi:acyl-coenzyme A thioesterase PaaI-like protein
LRDEFYHAAAAVHGSVYFRALDDAAFFAVNSRVNDVLVLAVSFTGRFTGPVCEGELEAVRLLVAESELSDQRDRLLAKGSGTFTRSRIALVAEIGHGAAASAAL